MLIEKNIQFLAAVLSVALMLNLSFVSFAAEKIMIPALGIEVMIPEEFTVITRSTPKDDPAFEKIGITKEEADTYFQQYNCYLNAVGEDSEITLTAVKMNDTEDFNKWTEEELNKFISDLRDMDANLGIDSEFTTHENRFTIFVKSVCKDSSSASIQYYTIILGYAVSITMQYSGTAYIEKCESQMQAIADSLDYISIDGDLPEDESMGTNVDEPEVTVPDAGNEQAEIFNDKETGMTFTVPENWLLLDSGDSETSYGDALLMISSGEGENAETKYIVFNSYDYWSEELSSAEKNVYKREDINSMSYGNGVVTNIVYDSNVMNLQRTEVVYSTLRYYRYDDVLHVDDRLEDSYSDFKYINGAYADEGLRSTDFVFVNNGWLYIFHYFGDPSDAEFDDFLELLKSASYCDVSPSNISLVNDGTISSGITPNTGIGANPAPNTPTEAVANTGSFMSVALGFCSIVFGVFIVIAIVTDRKKKKQERLIEERETLYNGLYNESDEKTVLLDPEQNK